MSRRSRLFWAAAILVLIALVLLAPPVGEDDPSAALRRFLAEMGFEVREGDRLPTDGTLILLHDLRAPDEVQPMLAWAEAGGDLVVADPGSAIVELVGASAGEPVGFVGTVELEPGCVVPGAVGVGRVTGRASDIALETGDSEFVSCFPAGDGAFLLTRRYGDGSLTLLGGASPFTNELLTQSDNALLAVQIASPGREVVFAPPGTPPAAGLWEALPEGARAAAVAAAVAAIAFALVRARRLGRPVLEEPITPIAGSELVRAAARMYRRAGATGYSATLLRNAFKDRFARRLGAAGEGELAAGVARATGVASVRVEQMLTGPEPRNDLQLIGLGRDLEELASRATARTTGGSGSG